MQQSFQRLKCCVVLIMFVAVVAVAACGNFQKQGGQVVAYIWAPVLGHTTTPISKASSELMLSLSFLLAWQ